MQWKRMFTTDTYKNTYQYIDTQKKYELIRTIIYFGISISLFLAGYITTKSNANLLTVVAVLGCLPASKSLVSTIMFFRFHSCDERTYQALKESSSQIDHLYDLIFTTEKINFATSHAAYRADCLILYAEQPLDAQLLENHIQEYMKRAAIKGVCVKVYTDLKKYTQRLEQLIALERTEDKKAKEVMQLLREITL